MSLAGPKSKSAAKPSSKSEKRSKKGPLSHAPASEKVETKKTSAEVKSVTVEKAKAKGKQKESETVSVEKKESAGKATPKKGILKNSKQQDTSASTSEKVPIPTKDQEDVEEEEIHLHGFSSESDSSDEEEDGVDEAPIEVGKLPTIARDDASVKRRLEKAKKLPGGEKGVIYLGRIPHGFYEDEMKAYFTQFGDVTRLRLSRNKRTGRSKHYAFIEFESAAVAQIVAETMDNYLMLGHLLRCKVMPKEDVHPQLWIGANRKFRRVPTDRISRQQQNKDRTTEQQEKAEQRLLKRQTEKKRKLVASGIDYDLDSVGYSKRSKQSAA